MLYRKFSEANCSPQGNPGTDNELIGLDHVGVF